eukprot:TRINITY_DN7650_c0_g1_i2.p1 TRINITY_DN7650_c0_g1~~TRINITY_DN7650_c0_g1_i2.p1  ORF type:complete len:296 (-),score=47.49 TRINITY_DN7650_c0_g1_i2:407-1294(-)
MLARLLRRPAAALTAVGPLSFVLPGGHGDDRPLRSRPRASAPAAGFSSTPAGLSAGAAVRCAEVSSSPGGRPAVLLFGDSITQFSFSEAGWGAGLYNWYHRAADVVNRGFSGYNTRWARQLLPGILANTTGSPLLVVTLFFGANDSESGGQHVPVEEYDANLRAMVGMIKAAHPKAAVVAITPPPVDKELWPTRSNEAVSRYAAVVRGLPVDAVVDLWGQIDIRDDLNDGLHLGPEGNRKVLRLVQEALRSLPGLNPEDDDKGRPRMLMHYPHWSEVTGTSKEEATSKLAAWRWA